MPIPTQRVIVGQKEVFNAYPYVENDVGLVLNPPIIDIDEREDSEGDGTGDYHAFEYQSSDGTWVDWDYREDESIANEIQRFNNRYPAIATMDRPVVGQVSQGDRGMFNLNGLKLGTVKIRFQVRGPTGSGSDL